ncbi:MAG: tRNA (N6-isopentenyl adenosine(37)-C2)-methylthiotransferase MiaB [Planctomycetota bacterium]|nr:tRNA (N6-isopentenyl adenosine(37)-C2)-methylthiotransferase MiaB [Planctomycetota bacterium]
MPRRFHIETVGCQMNVLDSELVTASLLAAGYEAATSRREADIILFNTCSVRQHAEDKIYSALGRLKHLKDQHPQKVIAVLGCMAQKDQAGIFKRAPHVDLVVGPGQIGRLPLLLAQVAAARQPLMEVSLGRRAASRAEVEQSFEAFDPIRIVRARHSVHQAMVRVMFGCDQFCTYCIVPSVRGPEQSRPIEQIESEVRQLADQGCVEVTLLGQTVNSYQAMADGRRVGLADLLDRLDSVAGLRRIKFVTNFPRGVGDDLLQAVRDLHKVAPYLHVPAQSGSNAILKRMKRGYTVEEYRQLLERIRATVPGAAVTSDFIVGFCGETERDFEQTVDLVRFGRFKNSFIFKYSPRTGTKADELFDDDVPEDVKRRRNNELLAVQNAISQEENEPFVGRTVEILVEGPSKAAQRHAGQGAFVQLTGRTACDRIVVFDGAPSLAGRMLQVEIESANSFTLFARPAGRPGAAGR